MILEFKRKADALIFQKMLMSLDLDMNTEQLREVFGLDNQAAEKLLYNHPCFFDLSPAERLTTERCEYYKCNDSYCLEIEYQFPEDGGQSEYDLAIWFEKLNRKIKLKMKSIGPLRKKSEYINNSIIELFSTENIRKRSGIIPFILSGKNGSFPSEKETDILNIFDKEIDYLEITGSNSIRILNACKSILDYYKDCDINETMSKRYSEIVNKITEKKDCIQSLPKADSYSTYRICFNKKDGAELLNEDIDKVIRVFLDNYGYATVDFRAYQLGNNGDGYDEIKSYSHLEKIIKTYPKGEKIYLNIHDNPVFYLNIFEEFVISIKSLRNDVLIGFSHNDFVIDNLGVHFLFECCDLIHPNDFLEKIVNEPTFSSLCCNFEKYVSLVPSIKVEK